MNIRNILITGGRAPATLHLCRLLKKASYNIYTAESIKSHLCKYSNSIKNNFYVPSPNDDYDGYINSLIEIIKDNEIDFVIPTCEEVFHIAKSKSKLEEFCIVFTDDFYKLNKLHNKFEFINCFKSYGFNVPATWKLTSYDDLKKLVNSFNGDRKFVLKPVYSRFASQVQFIKIGEKLPKIYINEDFPWILQEFIDGIQYCTYSIAHKGKLTAHTTYPTRFTAGIGANIYFEDISQSAIFNIINNFVLKENFTGQIAFDFILTKEGIPYVLECNPRATSGLHLFNFEEHLEAAFFNTTDTLLIPKASKPYCLKLAMLIYGVKNGYVFNKDWFKAIRNSKDVVFDKDDIKPFFGQFAATFYLLYKSLILHKTVLETTTIDIEMGGNI